MGTSQDGVTKNVHYHRYVNMIKKKIVTVNCTKFS